MNKLLSTLITGIAIVVFLPSSVSASILQDAQKTADWYTNQKCGVVWTLSTDDKIGLLVIQTESTNLDSFWPPFFGEPSSISIDSILGGRNIIWKPKDDRNYSIVITEHRILNKLSRSIKFSYASALPGVPTSTSLANSTLAKAAAQGENDVNKFGWFCGGLFFGLPFTCESYFSFAEPPQKTLKHVQPDSLYWYNQAYGDAARNTRTRAAWRGTGVRWSIMAVAGLILLLSSH